MYSGMFPLLLGGLVLNAGLNVVLSVCWNVVLGCGCLVLSRGLLLVVPSALARLGDLVLI
jgi:hypothetical protein